MQADPTCNKPTSNLLSYLCTFSAHPLPHIPADPPRHPIRRSRLENLEGETARLSQLASQATEAAAAGQDATKDGLKQLERRVRDVQRSVQLVRDQQARLPAARQLPSSFLAASQQLPGSCMLLPP